MTDITYMRRFLKMLDGWPNPRVNWASLITHFVRVAGVENYCDAIWLDRADREAFMNKMRLDRYLGVAHYGRPM